MGIKAAVIIIGLMSTVKIFADTACENRMAATHMMFLKQDPHVICESHPTPEAQQCITGILTKGKGKLRNGDLMDVVAYCETDSRPEMQTCFLNGLAAAPGTTLANARPIASKCLMARKTFPKKRALMSGRAVTK